MALMLVEAFARGMVKEGDYISYHPDYRECILSEAETGGNEKQTLKTEEFKYQFGGIIYGQLMLVADGVTESIFLTGMIGHKKGPDGMQRYVQECYSSKAFDAKGICLTETLFESLPKQLSKANYEYWLGSPYVILNSGYTTFGVRSVNNGGVYGRDLHYSDGYDSCDNYSIRPAVILPSDIKIDKNKNLIQNKD